MATLNQAFAGYADEVLDACPEKEEWPPEQLFAAEIARLIQFFSGKNQAWYYLPAAIKVALQDLVDPESGQWNRPDIRRLIDDQEKAALIKGLQELR